jgi:hypothetical protein
MRTRMLEESNTTICSFSRPTAAQAVGKQLPAKADVRLTVRVDIEDRGFHGETKRNGGRNTTSAPTPGRWRPAPNW